MGRPENIGIVIFVVVVVYMFVNEIHVNILVTKGLYGIKIKTFPKLYRGFFHSLKMWIKLKLHTHGLAYDLHNVGSNFINGLAMNDLNDRARK